MSFAKTVSEFTKNCIELKDSKGQKEFRIGVRKTTDDYHWLKLEDSEFIHICNSGFKSTGEKTRNCIIVVNCYNPPDSFMRWIFKNSGYTRESPLCVLFSTPVVGQHLHLVTYVNSCILQDVPYVSIVLSVILQE